MPKSIGVIESESARIKSALARVGEELSAFYAFRENSDKNVFRINTRPDALFMYYKASFTLVPRTCLIRYNRKACQLDLFLKQSSEVRADHLVFVPVTIATHTFSVTDPQTYPEIERMCVDWLKPKDGDERLVNQPQIPTRCFPVSLMSPREVVAGKILRAAINAVNGEMRLQLQIESSDPDNPVSYEVNTEDFPGLDYGNLAGKYYITNLADCVILDAIRFKRHFVEIDNPLKGTEHDQTQTQIAA